MNDQRLTERYHRNAIKRGKDLHDMFVFNDNLPAMHAAEADDTHECWGRKSPEMCMAWIALAETIRGNELTELRLEHDQDRNTALYDVSKAVEAR